MHAAPRSPPPAPSLTHCNAPPLQSIGHRAAGAAVLRSCCLRSCTAAGAATPPRPWPPPHPPAPRSLWGRGQGPHLLAVLRHLRHERLHGAGHARLGLPQRGTQLREAGALARPTEARGVLGVGGRGGVGLRVCVNREDGSGAGTAGEGREGRAGEEGAASAPGACVWSSHPCWTAKIARHHHSQQARATTPECPQQVGCGGWGEGQAGSQAHARWGGRLEGMRLRVRAGTHC